MAAPSGLGLLAPWLGAAEGATDTLLGAEDAVCALCRHLFDPELEPSTISSLDSRVIVVIGGGRCVRELLFTDHSVFPRLPSMLQIRLLDVLIRALRDNVYNVVRFCCNASDPQVLDQGMKGDGGVLHKLLDLLPHVEHRHAVATRVIGLIGVIGTAGIQARDLKRFLALLRRPCFRLTRAVLQALKTIMRQDVTVTKASPISFFNFGGEESGLMIPPMAWPFPYGYQLSVWFRIERFPAGSQRAHLFTFLTHHGHGVDVYLTSEGKIYITIADRRTSGVAVSETIELEGLQLYTRAWYFIDIQHTRSRLGFLGKDTMTVNMDHRLVYRGHPRYPKNVGWGPQAEGADRHLRRCSIGEGFDGQMAPVYVFVEPVSQAITDALAAYHASNEFQSAALDLDPTPLGLTSKAFSSKLLLVYHPDRCSGQVCLDLHNGNHGIMAPRSRVWGLDRARDVVASIGGVAALFPLLYLILIADDRDDEQDQHRQEGEGADETLFYRSDSDIEGEKQGRLPVLLSILARMLRTHEINQRELHRIGGIDMLEYVISRTPASVLRAEDVGNCLRAILELCDCSAGTGHPARETQMLRRLLSPHLWRRAPVHFQLQLLKTLISYVRASPATAREVVTGASVLGVSRTLYIYDNASERPPQSEENEGEEEDEGRDRRGPPASNGDGRGAGGRHQQQSDGGGSAGMSLIRMFRTSTFSHLSTGEATAFMVSPVRSGDVVATRKEKEKLRWTSLQIIITQCHEEITEKDLRPLMEFLACFTEVEVELAEEVLQVLLYWLQPRGDAPPPPGLLEAIRSIFVSSQAFAAFLMLGVVNRETDYLRATGLRVLSAYLIVQDAATGEGNGNNGSHSGSSRAIHRGPVDRFLLSSGGAFLWHYLQQHVDTIDEHTYAALLEMLLAHRRNLRTLTIFSRPVVTVNCFVPSVLQPAKIIDDVDEIHNVMVLTIILKLLPSLPHHLKERAYNDLLLLLKFSERNRQLFVSMAGWQVRLFELVAPFIIPAESEGDDEDDDEDGEEEEEARGGGLVYQPGVSVTSLLRSEAPFTEQGYAATYHLLNSPRRAKGQRAATTAHQSEAPLATSSSELSVDQWIDMAMKLHVLILQHTLAFSPHGWQEVARALSLEFFNSKRTTSGTTTTTDPSTTTRSHGNNEQQQQQQQHLPLIALCSHLLTEANALLKKSGPSGRPEPHYDTNLRNAAFLMSTFLLGSPLWSVIPLSIQGLGIRPPRGSSPPAPPLHHDSPSPSPPPSYPYSSSPDSPEIHDEGEEEEEEEEDTATFILDRPLLHYKPHQDNTSSVPRAGGAWKRISGRQTGWRSGRNGGGGGMPGNGGGNLSGTSTKGSAWVEQCDGSGRSVFFRFPAFSAVFGRRVAERSGTVLVATQLLQLLDGLFVRHAAPAASSSPRQQQENVEGDWEEREAPKTPTGATSPTSSSSPLNSIPETPQALAFLQQKGPLRSSGSVAALMLRLSLLVLSTVHPVHPLAIANTARLRRLARLMCCLPSTKVHDNWLILLLVHVQSALRRLRDTVIETVAPTQRPPPHEQHQPPTSPSSSSGGSSSAASAGEKCAFCTGELQGVVTEIEDLFEVLDTLNRVRPALISAAMGADSDSYSSLCSMLLARKVAYRRSTRRRPWDPQLQKIASFVGDCTDTDSSQATSSSRTLDRRRHTFTEENSPLRPLRGPSVSPTCLSCYDTSPAAADGAPEPLSQQLPWKLRWLLNPWIDIALIGSQPRIREAAAKLVMQESAATQEQKDYLWSYCAVQIKEEKAWKAFDSRRSDMYLDGRTLKVSLEEADHQRTSSRMASMDLQQRAAVAKWATVMRTLSAEWSPWAVEDEKSRWKISTHADKFRRRMLLSRTDKFDDHRDAAYSAVMDSDDDEDVDVEDWAEKGGEGDEARGDSQVAGNGRPDERDVLLMAKGLFKVQNPAAAAAGEEGEEDTGSVHRSLSGGAAGSGGGGSGGGGREAAMSLSSRAGTPTPLDSPTREREQKQGRPAWADHFEEGEQWVTSQVAKMVNPHGSVSGVAILTTRHLYFHPDRNMPANDQFKGQHSYTWKDKMWRLDRITEVHGRRHLLRSCALEVYFTDAHEVFMAFQSPKERAIFYSKLSRQRTPLLATPRSLKPADVLRESKYTDQWRRRQISNFEYLMRLNIIAGRSYNDINQYPVFPWVLSNYTSEEIDLNDPANYRDLSKPVGALNPKRLEMFKDRYEAFEDEVVPKFLFGSHYSTAGLVLHFLLRQEPFATLAIKLQSGSFDNPNRLFFDLLSSWRGCQESTSDVKELVPELFCMPEILLNTNKYPLGRLDDGKGAEVGDVRLPPWAKNAFDFVRINRLALESDYVSKHLHHWIDLIFGYKQRGEEAVEADNVFYYLTYEGAVDIDAIRDPVLRNATEAQIKHYGQTPSQLLTTPHPARHAREECVLALCYSTESLENLRAYTPLHQLPAVTAPPGDGHSGPPILSAAVVQSDRLVVVYADLTVATYRWSSMPDIHDFPFTVRPERAKQLPCHAVSMSSYAMSPLLSTRHGAAAGHVRTSSQEDEGGLRNMGSWNFAVNGDRIMCCGYWDHSVKCYHGLEGGFRLEANTSGGHRGAINCLQMGEDGITLVTGGQDGTCRVWVADNGSVAAALMTDCAYLGVSSTRQGGGAGGGASDSSSPSSASPPHHHLHPLPVSEAQTLQCVAILWGQETAVISMSFSTHLDLLASGSVGGAIVIHQVRKGKYVRRISYPTSVPGSSTGSVKRTMSCDHDNRPPVNLLHLAQHSGDLVAHSWQDCSLHTFSLNGFHLAATRVKHRLYAMTVTQDGQMLVAGGASSGIMTVHLVHSLQLLHELPIGNGPIRSLSFTPDHQYIILGSANGQFTVVADPLSRLQMLHRVLSRTFLGGLA